MFTSKRLYTMILLMEKCLFCLKIRKSYKPFQNDPKPRVFEVCIYIFVLSQIYHIQADSCEPLVYVSLSDLFHKKLFHKNRKW